MLFDRYPEALQLEFTVDDVDKRKPKIKRQASSPLDDNGHLNVNNSEQKTGQKKKKCKRDTKTEIVTLPVSPFLSNINFTYDPNMTFQQQGPSFGMPQPQSYMQSPPPIKWASVFNPQLLPHHGLLNSPAHNPRERVLQYI